MTEEVEGLLLADIRITRVLEDDRDHIYVVAADANGDTLPLIESLGLLRFAEDTVIRERMGEVPDGS